jgi:thioesterase domain-containing protein
VWSALAPIQPRGSKPPFFWVHGDASTGFLATYLGTDQPLYGLEHQSQDGKPARYTTVEAIASHYLDEVRSIQSAGPYFLGGFSFGGWIAFEMAQQLRKNGEQVNLLVLLDSDFPGEPVADSIESAHVHPSAAAEFRRHLRRLALLEPRHWLAYLIVRIKGKLSEPTTRATKSFETLYWNIWLRMGRPIPISFLSRYLSGIYKKALHGYKPYPYSGRVIYVKAEKRSNHHRTSWDGIIRDGLEWHEVPGDHGDLVTQPDVHFWADKLKEWLDAAQRNQRADIVRDQTHPSPSPMSSEGPQPNKLNSRPQWTGTTC